MHTLVVLSDSHAGFRLGLCPPNVVLTDNYTPRLTASQEFLWDLYTKASAYIARFAAGSPITILHLGDPAHGTKYAQELVTTIPADQIRIGVANWRPLLELPGVERVRCATSTEAHSLGESSTDHLISDQLSILYPAIDTKVVHHGEITIDGFTIDYAHHGPGPGSRIWLGGNVARYYLTSIILAHTLNGTRPPDLVLRGHMHTPVDETVTKGRYRSRVIVCPALCMPGRHAIQVTQSLDRCTVGMMVFKIEGGKIVDEKNLFQTIDLRVIENVNDTRENNSTRNKPATA
jgi:hypothetical protein